MKSATFQWVRALGRGVGAEVDAEWRILLPVHARNGSVPANTPQKQPHFPRKVRACPAMLCAPSRSRRSPMGESLEFPRYLDMRGRGVRPKNSNRNEVMMMQGLKTIHRLPGRNPRSTRIGLLTACLLGCTGAAAWAQESVPASVCRETPNRHYWYLLVATPNDSEPSIPRPSLIQPWGN